MVSTRVPVRRGGSFTNTQFVRSTHSKEGEGSREGTRRTSTFSGWPLAACLLSAAWQHGWRRGASSAGDAAGPRPRAGRAGPLRWGAQHGPGIEGPWWHGASAAAGCARLLRPAAARGSFSCWRRRAAEGPPQHEASAAAGGRGSFSRQRRGAPSAGGGAGQWPLASSIYGGWRVSSWGQARVRQTTISWAVGFSHGPVAWGPIHLHRRIVKTHLFSFADWCFYRLIRGREILKYRQIVR